jgi:TolB-like protein/tetratricopeptide (TPR) repeat protein
MEDQVISENLIREQLDDILSSQPFQHSRLLSSFLSFVVEETLAGRENQVKEYTIATQVLGRSAGFLNQKDASVRIHAMRLRKLLFDYYAHGNGNIKVVIELPKGTYKPVFTPMNGHHDHEQTRLSRPGKRGAEGRIGIVPFACLIDLEEVNFSCPGFCEYLSEKLSMFQDVSVVSYHAIESFVANGGRNEDLEDEFGLECYLTGSIETRHGEMVVSVQLLDAQENTLIWSSEHKAKVSGNEMVDVIDLIAKRIVSSIGGYTGYAHFRMFQKDESKARIAGKAADAIFWVYQYISNQSREVYEKAVREMEIHMKEDDPVALSYALLAQLYCDGLIYMYDTSPERLELARLLVAKSLALDPECQHAYLTKAWLHVIDQEWDEARAAADKMISLNPNSSYFMSIYSFGMAVMQEYDLSIRYWEEALLLNPLPYWWLSFPCTFKALTQGQYEIALFHARKVGTPKQIFESIFEMVCLYRLNRLSEMRELKKKYLQHYPEGLPHVRNVFGMIVKDPVLREMIVESLNAIIQDDPAPAI